MNTVIIRKDSDYGAEYLESIANHIEELLQAGKSVEVTITEADLED